MLKTNLWKYTLEMPLEVPLEFYMRSVWSVYENVRF